MPCEDFWFIKMCSSAGDGRAYLYWVFQGEYFRKSTNQKTIPDWGTENTYPALCVGLPFLKGCLLTESNGNIRVNFCQRTHLTSFNKVKSKVFKPDLEIPPTLSPLSPPVSLPVLIHDISHTAKPNHAHQLAPCYFSPLSLNRFSQLAMVLILQGTVGA